MQTRARCACGKVELAIAGAPILSVACYCDDCQAGARQIAALPGATAVAGADGGTPYLMYRRDRVAVVTGGEFLTPLKLRDSSATNRLVASCCNTAMFVGFDRGPHWVSLYPGPVEGEPPALEMRVQTRFAPDPAAIPDDGVPAHRGVTPGFVIKLLASLFPLPVRRQALGKGR